PAPPPRRSTRSLHDALPIFGTGWATTEVGSHQPPDTPTPKPQTATNSGGATAAEVERDSAPRNLDAIHEFAQAGPIIELCGTRRSEEHTSELQSRFDLVCRL